MLLIMSFAQGQETTTSENSQKEIDNMPGMDHSQMEHSTADEAVQGDMQGQMHEPEHNMNNTVSL